MSTWRQNTVANRGGNKEEGDSILRTKTFCAVIVEFHGVLMWAQQDEKRQKQVLEQIRTESTRDTQRVLAQQKPINVNTVQ